MTVTKDLNIDVHKITRVEGHGNITVNAKNGRIEKILWSVPESPRFFEAMVRERSYKEVCSIVSRICGICSVGHQMASLEATEDAFGITPSEQTVMLRKLILHGETIQSHVLHYYFLAAPDFLGVNSVFPLVKTHPDVVLRALRLKKLANDIVITIGGRAIHPIRLVVKGFSKLPTAKELKNLQAEIKSALKDFDATVKLFATLKLPDFQRETEYISLKNTKEYAFYDGKICSSDTGLVPAGQYRKITNEYCVSQSTAKYTKHNRESYFVGALSRFNNNFKQLSPLAQKAAKTLGLKAPCHNPYMNTIAQVVESIHAAEDAIRLIDKILKKGIKAETPKVKVKAGTGVGAVEVPRGILFHEYTYDKKGILVNANCIIPTNQNHANIQKDMEGLVPKILDKSKEEITLGLEMLVRAYDPCISCSTHMLKVEFV
ncbi:MAG: Ni/Fe hydrogenase subunit alpha [Planctomycetes bacterium]|nr:Ni/Fe hydrogenase subunit alpha [Planctomycetota bacterium]